ncbi:MAG TPA: glycosyltransferase family A protein, partial [Acidimicrobiales bacterium]|nr:glycosyltransferase family A protein [Acidimicrobiales bacterium]
MSVIVPVRNRRELLRCCLDALGGQTLGDHEVIVVDDGSTDGSGEEAWSDERSGRPVRVLRTPSVGAVAARAAGIRAARGQVLAFTDSDCTPTAGWLAAGVAAIRAGAAVAVGPTWPAGPVRPLERSLASDGRDGLYATSNVFYERAALEAAGGFDPRAGSRLRVRPGRTLRGTGFGEDTLLAWRVIRAGGGTAVCPGAVVHHYVFPADLADSVRRAWSVGAFPA